MADFEKGFQERFARFFEEPTRDKLREILRDNIGETNQLDFKSDWPNSSKMAKHLLAFANNGGGCIVMGVSEEDGTLESEGIDKKMDKSEFHSRVDNYIPSKLPYKIVPFTYPDSEYKKIVGSTFQVIFIEDSSEHIPFVSKQDGSDIRKAAIYTRRGTQSVEANYEDLQGIINRRIETKYSTESEIELEKHLSELKVLYSHLDRYKVYRKGGFSNILDNMVETILQGEQVKEENPKYPEEDFEDFVSKMIDLKKDRIRTLLIR